MTATHSYSSLTIKCVRDVNTEENDDCITIKPYLSSAFEQMYSVVHKVGTEHSPDEYQIKTTTELTGDGLVTYMDSLLDLLYYDEDPFECIQFDIPSLPSILVKPHNLDLVKDRVLSYLESLLSSSASWPRNAHIQNTTAYPVQSVETGVSVKKNKHKKNKHKKNKHSNKDKNHVHTCDSCPSSRAQEEDTRTHREHLFFDEDNNITSYYYNL